MIRVFLDTSVLFAAIHSSTGAARDVIRLAIQGKIEIIVSDDVLDEVERNLTRKIPEKVAAFRQLMQLVAPEVISGLTREQIEAAQSYVAHKDTPIIAAAVQSQPDYLVTYDRKHLLDPPEVARNSGLRIVTPDVVVRAVQEQGDEST